MSSFILQRQCRRLLSNYAHVCDTSAGSGINEWTSERTAVIYAVGFCINQKVLLFSFWIEEKHGFLLIVNVIVIMAFLYESYTAAAYTNQPTHADYFVSEMILPIVFRCV